jgi:hypothetical protein
MYVVEEYVDESGKAQLPRRIVGRAYRTGKVISNITNTVDMLTFTYSAPFK